MTATTSPTHSEPPVAPQSPELPVHLTRFVGRDREVHDLAHLIRSTRVLTLTGAGGSGKTRLAREVAAHCAGDFARMAWVDLASLTSAELLPLQVAAAMHVPERPGVTPLRNLIEAIGETPVLLVLDNCEHLVDACAELADALLRACPRLTVLATSREALGVSSESAWLVPPLASAEAIQLFVERAQSVLPSFVLAEQNAAAIGEICRKLDGIPLAIELAATRVRVLTPEQIATRLSDAIRLLTSGSRTALPRHRTLRATMDWSFGLLGAREQTLLARLAAFAGSFSLEAAEAVCAGEPLEPEDILDGVSALVDKSLVVMEPGEGEARYRLLETVRQYAEERLTSAGEASALRERHARWFLELAETAEPYLFAGAANPEWVARVTVEVDNLRAASLWAEEDASRSELAMRLAFSLHWFWFATNQFREARQRINKSIALPNGAAAPVHRGRALLVSGFIKIVEGDATCRVPLEEALTLLAGRDEPRNVAYLLACLTAGCLFVGDFAAALQYGEEALSVVAAVPPHPVHSFVRYYFGRAAEAHGDVARARDAFQHAVDIGRQIEHRPAIAHPLAMLGRLAYLAGDDDDAFARFAESLEIHSETRDMWGVTVCLEGLAAVATSREQYSRAARLMAAADALRVDIASALSPMERDERARRLEKVRSNVGDAFKKVYDEGASLPLPHVISAALGPNALQTQEHRVVQMRAEAPVRRASGSYSMADLGRLRVQALGPLQVFIGERLVDQSAWGSARPRELLVYLLMYPEGRTKEQVGLAFWPDASAAQLRNSFHVTLHRLRKALGGSEWVALSGDRYRIEPSMVDEFDVAAFQADIVAARRAVTRQEEGAPGRLEQALARFRGDFLDGEPVGDWHLEHRDHLQQLYVEALMQLGARYAGEERYAKAADAYRRVLARDELHEEALQALMRCHAALGERAQALRAYRRFADKLQAELEVEPGNATVKLYERLQAG